MPRSLLFVSLLASAAIVGTSYAKPAVAKKSVAGKPKIGTFGFDTPGMDKTVKPGDDFAAYAGGMWLKNTEIPADRASWCMFNVLQHVSLNQTHPILDDAAKTPANKIGDFYASFMEEAAANAKGVDPIKP